jgi:hypothetical protein
MQLKKLKAWLASLISGFRKFLWNHSRIYSYLWHGATGFVPFFIANYYGVDDFGDSFKSTFPDLAKLLDRNPVQWVILSFIWIPIADAIRKWLSSVVQDAPERWVIAPSVLVKCFDEIVGHKERRFSKFYNAILNAPRRKKTIPENGAIFDKITQPEAQITRIGEALHSAFCLLTDRQVDGISRVKVSFALIENDKIIDFIFHAPPHHPVKSKVDDLNNPNSGIMKAYSSGEIVVIESFLKEVSKNDPCFVTTKKGGTGEDGSMLCYTVELTSKPRRAIVISVLHSEARTFEKRYSKKYAEVLRSFALRIQLEYSLLGLKGLAQYGKQQPAATN